MHGVCCFILLSVRSYMYYLISILGVRIILFICMVVCNKNSWYKN